MGQFNTVLCTIKS